MKETLRATVGDVSNSLHRVLRTRVHNMRSPALTGKLETLLNQVDRNDGKSAGKPGQCGDKLPNDANPEDNHRLVDLQTRPSDCVQRRSPVNRKRRLLVGQTVVQLPNIAVLQRRAGHVDGPVRGVAPHHQNPGARREVDGAPTHIQDPPHRGVTRVAGAAPASLHAAELVQLRTGAHLAA